MATPVNRTNLAENPLRQISPSFPLAIRLHPDIESRLERLAKTFYAREAILEHLEDLEDTYLASRRLERPAKIYSAEEVKHELGL